MTPLTNTASRNSVETLADDDYRESPEDLLAIGDKRRDEFTVFPQRAYPGSGTGAGTGAERRPDVTVRLGDEPVPADTAIPVDEYGDAILGLFEQSGIGLAILNPSLRVQFVNEAFVARCGRDHEYIYDRSIAEFIHPSVRDQLMRQFDRVAKGQRARIVGRPATMWFADTAAAGNLTVFPVDHGEGASASGDQMLLVLFTPDKSESDRSSLADPQLKLTTLTSKVLEGVAAGDSTVRLATKLFLSRQGIEYHVSILLRQFKVPNRTALVAKAYSIGMFSIGTWPPRLLSDYVRHERPTAASASSANSGFGQVPALAGASADRR